MVVRRGYGSVKRAVLRDRVRGAQKSRCPAQVGSGHPCTAAYRLEIFEPKPAVPRQGRAGVDRKGDTNRAPARRLDNAWEAGD